MYFQAFELTTLQNIRETGTSLRLIFLLGKLEKTTDADLEKYKNMGIFGLGLDKDMLVIKSADNHINFTNVDLIDRIHAKGTKVLEITNIQY